MTVYSQIIYLEEELTKRIRTIQKRLFKLTGSRACLDIWYPHLTIGDALDIKGDQEEKFYQDIRTAIKNFKPFKVEIKNYNFMDDWPGGKLPGYNPYAIYLDVIVNNKLQKLAESINNNVSKNFKSWYKQPWPYKPHVTVASKDLNQEGFSNAKEILKNETFNGKIVIDHVSIARENEKGQWEEYKRFRF